MALYVSHDILHSENEVGKKQKTTPLGGATL